MNATAIIQAAAQGRYFVKCDECRETMRYTDSVQESAAGGRCEKCRAEIAAKLAKPVAPKYSAAAREIAAYEADIYKAKRNARVATKMRGSL